MSFSTDTARLVAEQLSRFVTLNRHQLAGQVANFDFWLAQIRNVLGIIDGYSVRFLRMEGAQERYVTAHRTTESIPDVDGFKERRASPPRRISDSELRKARRALIDAASRFLERCRRDGLISESQLSEACRNLGIE